MTAAPALPDGSYDALIIDATRRESEVRVELTIIAGTHKGEVVSLIATGVAGDELDLVGLPATITVTAGGPRVVVDR
jgi:hypothetical protein